MTTTNDIILALLKENLTNTSNNEHALRASIEDLISKMGIILDSVDNLSNSYAQSTQSVKYLAGVVPEGMKVAEIFDRYKEGKEMIHCEKWTYNTTKNYEYKNASGARKQMPVQVEREIVNISYNILTDQLDIKYLTPNTMYVQHNFDEAALIDLMDKLSTLDEDAARELNVTQGTCNNHLPIAGFKEETTSQRLSNLLTSLTCSINTSAGKDILDVEDIVKIWYSKH